MNIQCPLSDEAVLRISREAGLPDCIDDEYLRRGDWQPAVIAFASAVAAAAVEAERRKGCGEAFDRLAASIEELKAAGPRIEALKQKYAIPEDRAALAEECKRVAHHLFDISPEAEDMVHLSMAIDRLAASPPPSAAPEGWQLVPKEPTSLMLERMQDQAPASTMDLRNAWISALAAAPKEPT